MKHMYILLALALLGNAQEPSTFYQRAQMKFEYENPISTQARHTMRMRAIWGTPAQQSKSAINCPEVKHTLAQKNEEDDLDIWLKVGPALTKEWKAQLLAELFQECIKNHSVQDCIQEIQ